MWLSRRFLVRVLCTHEPETILVRSQRPEHSLLESRLFCQEVAVLSPKGTLLAVTWCHANVLKNDLFFCLLCLCLRRCYESNSTSEGCGDNDSERDAVDGHAAPPIRDGMKWVRQTLSFALEIGQVK